MENYTKYRLKGWEELADLLESRDNLFFLSCNKCFKEFDTVQEPELEQLTKLAEGLDKKVTGTAKADFLCNKVKAKKGLATMIPEGTQNVVVISCGLGIQTVADVTGKSVIAAADSVGAFHHGMALTEKRCDACAQCYLNITGGICPIVDCSKSLINGQCGGCKDGKCEVSPDKDCAWQKIQERLEAQGRIDELKTQAVHTFIGKNMCIY